MAVLQQGKVPSDLTMEKMWEYFHANVERSEREREEDRKLREEEHRLRKEELAELREIVAENTRRAEKIDEGMGKLGIRFGEVVEHLVAPGIRDSFEGHGFLFDMKSARRRKIKEGGKVVAEVDLLLENDEEMMIVEVKARVSSDDVREHAARMERLRGYFDRRGDGRRLMGAIAGAVFWAGDRIAARKAGFFTITQSGDTMEIDVPEGFEPRAW